MSVPDRVKGGLSEAFERLVSAVIRSPDRAFLAAAAAFLAIKLSGLFLSISLPAGWNFAFHLSALNGMDRAIRELDVSGLLWNPKLLGGAPVLYSLPIVPYSLVLAIHYLSLTMLPMEYALRLALFLECFGFIWAFLYCARHVFASVPAAVASIFGFFFLFADPKWRFVGIGIPAAVHLGELHVLPAAAFFLVFIGDTMRFLNGKERRYAARSLLWLTCVLLCDFIYFAIALIWFIFQMFASPLGGRDRFKLLAKSCMFFVLLVGFWIFPAGRQMAYTGRDVVAGLSFFSDPLLVFYDVHSVRILLMVFCLVGAGWLIAGRQWVLPAILVITFAVLPRNFLSEHLAFPIAYYRFMGPLYLIYVMLAAYGFARIVELTLRTFRERWILTAAIGVLIAPAVVLFFDYPVSGEIRIFEKGVIAASYRHPWGVEKPVNPDDPRTRLVEWSRGENEFGRIVTIMDEESTRTHGNPYSLDYLVGTVGGAHVISGGPLIYSGAARHMTAAYAGMGTFLPLSGLPRVSFNVSVNESINRLETLGVRYLVTDNEVISGTFESKYVENKFHNVQVIRIPDPQPLVYVPRTRPSVFIGPERGKGITWAEFSALWGADRRFRDYPLIKSRAETLTDFDLNEMSGSLCVLISDQSITDMDVFLEKVRALLQMGRKVILLNYAFTSVDPGLVSIHPFWADRGGLSRVLEVLINIRSENLKAMELDPVVINVKAIENNGVTFEPPKPLPAIVNFNYSPHLRAITALGKVPIYPAAPAGMYVFSPGGSITIKAGLGALEIVPAIVSLVSFLLIGFVSIKNRLPWEAVKPRGKPKGISSMRREVYFGFNVGQYQITLDIQRKEEK